MNKNTNYITEGYVCALLNISIKTLYSYVDIGSFPKPYMFMFNGKAPRWNKTIIDKFVNDKSLLLRKTVLVIFNGPPRVGKDTVSLLDIPNTIMRMSDRIKDGCHVSWGLVADTDHYEYVKDTPSVDFGGLTPREAYIKYSNDQISIHGIDVFGKLMASDIVSYKSIHKEDEDNIIFMPGAGILSELLPVIDIIGIDNVLVVELSKTGCSYAHDSRGYISNQNPPKGLQIKKIRSFDGKIGELKNVTSIAVKNFLHDKKVRYK